MRYDSILNLVDIYSGIEIRFFYAKATDIINFLNGRYEERPTKPIVERAPIQLTLNTEHRL